MWYLNVYNNNNYYPSVIIWRDNRGSWQSAGGRAVLESCAVLPSSLSDQLIVCSVWVVLGQPATHWPWPWWPRCCTPPTRVDCGHTTGAARCIRSADPTRDSPSVVRLPSQQQHTQRFLVKTLKYFLTDFQTNFWLWIAPSRKTTVTAIVAGCITTLWYECLRWLPLVITTTWRTYTTEPSPCRSQSTLTRCSTSPSISPTMVTMGHTMVSILTISSPLTRQPWSRRGTPWGGVRLQYVIYFRPIIGLRWQQDSMNNSFLLLILTQLDFLYTKEWLGPAEPNPSMFLSPVDITTLLQLQCQDWRIMINSSNINNNNSRQVLTTVIPLGTIGPLYQTCPPLHIPCNNNHTISRLWAPASLWPLHSLLTAVWNMTWETSQPFPKTVNPCYLFILITLRSVAVSQQVPTIGRSSLAERVPSPWRILPRECCWTWGPAVAWQDPPDPVPDKPRLPGTTTPSAVRSSWGNCLASLATLALVWCPWGHPPGATPPTPSVILQQQQLSSINNNSRQATKLSPPLDRVTIKPRCSPARGSDWQVWTTSLLPLLLLPLVPMLSPTIIKTWEYTISWLFNETETELLVMEQVMEQVNGWYVNDKTAACQTVISMLECFQCRLLCC